MRNDPTKKPNVDLQFCPVSLNPTVQMCWSGDQLEQEFGRNKYGNTRHAATPGNAILDCFHGAFIQESCKIGEILQSHQPARWRRLNHSLLLWLLFLYKYIEFCLMQLAQFCIKVAEPGDLPLL